MIDPIAIDFVPGTHGHFLETTLNKFFGIASDINDPFTATGTSHKKSSEYNKSKVFHSEHWFELYPEKLKNFKKVISINFTADDLLLVSSISLLRAGDRNIDNNILEVDTVKKLNNRHYRDTLALIYQSYPFLDTSEPSIPRYVLREFYKFGFKNTDVNGYWIKQKQMQYHNSEVCYFSFSSFHNYNKFVDSIKSVEKMCGLTFDFSPEFKQRHEKFLSFINCLDHKQQCDDIVESVKRGIDVPVPELTLFQESYINGQLENIYNKEMPFHQDRYFTSTKDMLYYIDNIAPKL